MLNMPCSRRKFLGTMGAAAGALAVNPVSFLASSAPAGKVAVGVCHGYGSGVTPTLATLFDQLGGMESLVRGKTVAMKINLTGNADQRLDYIPIGNTHWTHPDVIGATVHLLSKAGATRIRILESPWNTAEPLEEFMLQANWEPRHFISAGTRVEFENTNYLGYAKKYSRFMVPSGGLMYKGYDLNHSYEDCDVFVSIAKMKEHMTAGVTLSMKNCFGMTPCTIYGEGADENEPSPVPHGGRGPFHYGNRPPSKSAPAPIELITSRGGGYRVPRVVADLVSSRPIHLAIVDGIETINKTEGPWGEGCKYIKPGLLVAGTNCVNTDAVCMSLMGFDPMSDRGTAPFETADSTLRLAEGLGVGTRDLSRIEVLGTPIEKCRFDFRKA